MSADVGPVMVGFARLVTVEAFVGSTFSLKNGGKVLRSPAPEFTPEVAHCSTIVGNRRAAIPVSERLMTRW